MSDDRNPSRVHQEGDELNDRLRELGEQGEQPSRDLWPEIEAQLQPRRRGVGLGLAAAALLALLGVGWWFGAGEVRPVELVSARSPEDAVLDGGTPELQQTFDLYLRERQRLLSSVSRALADHPQDLRREVRESLRALEEASLHLERTLAIESDDATEGQLAALYDLELRLLSMTRDRLQSASSRGGAR